jgi:hypothetical protein
VLEFYDADVANAIDEAFAQSVDAALEAELLKRLASTGTPAADFVAAYAACQPVATHLVGNPAVVLATANANGGAASLTALGLTIIATANYDGALVLHAPACPIVVTPRLRGRAVRPAVLGSDVGFWRYGIAAARAPAACQVVEAA